MVKNYKDLLFWKTSFSATKEILKLTKTLPRDYTTKILISQLVRSSSSVGANIAEGFGRYKGKEYQRFLQIALGSANETEYWLLVFLEMYPRFRDKIDIIQKLNLETIKMLVTTLRTLRSRK